MASPITRAVSPQIFRSSGNLLGKSPASITVSRSLKVEHADWRSSPVRSKPLLSNRTPHTYNHNQSLLINTPNKNNLLNHGLGTNHNIQMLGQGSFGIVVKGIYQDKEVAVKIVKLHSFALREKNALMMTHKNIVKVLEVILDHNGNYGIIIMEYVQSARHLQSILDNKNTLLTPIVITRFAIDICKGLQYIHRKNVLHLDIKPNNILVCQDTVCKLCDFGNSLNLESVEEVYTHQGSVVYTAPEILTGNRPTAMCDIYSLGILLWQMRYRDKPYQTLEDAQVIIYKVVKFNLRPQNPCSSLSMDKYASIYWKCWSTNPNERPEVSEVIKEFEILNTT